MKEKLQEYALIAEIVSALAIVLSLIFVGLQVRQSAEQTAMNSQAVQASVRQAMLQNEFNMLFYAGDHDVMGIDITQDHITPEQRNAYQALEIAFFHARENAWVQHEKGILDDATYYSYRDAFIKNLLNNKGLRDFWTQVTTDYNFVPGFVADANAELKKRYGDK